MLQDHILVGVHITDRVTHAVDVQNVLTTYGCNIKTRLGLHEVGDGKSGAPNGLVVLEFVGTKTKCAALCKQLKAITGVDAKTMTFEHS